MTIVSSNSREEACIPRTPLVYALAGFSLTLSERAEWEMHPTKRLQLRGEAKKATLSPPSYFIGTSEREREERNGGAGALERGGGGEGGDGDA